MNPMNSWNNMWYHFDKMMEEMGNMFTATRREINIVNYNGDLTINGDITKLTINGHQIRVPDYVMKGKSK